MTDITKCNSQTCQLRLKCCRYTAPASENQSYADFGADMNGNGMGYRMILADPEDWKELDHRKMWEKRAKI